MRIYQDRSTDLTKITPKGLYIMKGTVFTLRANINPQTCATNLFLDIRILPEDMVTVEFEEYLTDDEIAAINIAIPAPYILSGGAELQRKIGAAIEYFISEKATLSIEIDPDDQTQVEFYLQFMKREKRAAAPLRQLKNFVVRK